MDLLATFLVAGTFEQRVGVQAKHYYSDDQPAGTEVIAQLVTGIEAEGVTQGMVITSGIFSQEAKDSVEQVYIDKGYRIELIDSETLAGFLVFRTAVFECLHVKNRDLQKLYAVARTE